MSKIGIGVITVGKRPIPDYLLREMCLKCSKTQNEKVHPSAETI